MGMIPPPPPGAVLILEPGVDYFEITGLGDTERRFVPGLQQGAVPPLQIGTYEAWVAEQQRRAWAANEARAATLRENTIGAGLMLAALITSLAALWSVL